MKKFNQNVKRYYKKTEKNDKIINTYKLLKSYIHLHVPITWFSYITYSPAHKQNMS